MDGSFGAEELVTELSSPMADGAVFLTADGLTAYLSSARPGGVGGLDSWAATRARPSDAFEPPVNLV